MTAFSSCRIADIHWNKNDHCSNNSSNNEILVLLSFVGVVVVINVDVVKSRITRVAFLFVRVPVFLCVWQSGGLSRTGFLRENNTK